MMYPGAPMPMGYPVGVPVAAAVPAYGVGMVPATTYMSKKQAKKYRKHMGYGHHHHKFKFGFKPKKFFKWK